MNLKTFSKLTLLLFSCGLLHSQETKIEMATIDTKVDSLMMGLMTLEEKIGQLNQYNGFWDVTGPAPETGNAALKYKHLESDLVGSMLKRGN